MGDWGEAANDGRSKVLELDMARQTLDKPQRVAFLAVSGKLAQRNPL
jgi:hypothetical protein